ncbi:MAG TPA: Uma2 family endonuclease [Candidatus Angelobacter sp.]|nr:Uma2 family endonuclease [Candidatus Angelobacter sp.]
MSATTRISFDEFLKMQESKDAVCYELDEGELLVPPSPTIEHNEIRFRIHRALRDFSRSHQLGYVTGETDFLLGPDTVRRPDVAFLTTAHLQRINIKRSPVEGAPALAVEVISPTNLAQDTFKKVHQYLASGSEVVWLVYPQLKVIEVHDHTRTYEVSQGLLKAEKLLPGLDLSLAEIFDEDLLK